MARQFSKLQDYVVLRNGAAAVIANTADAEKTNARIANMRAGYAIVTVHAVDATSNDEKYTITIEGRDAATDGYTVLGTLVLAAAAIVGANPGSVAAAAGAFVVDLDVTKKRLRSNLVVAGTTPSIQHSVVVVSGDELTTYRPGGVVITD